MVSNRAAIYARYSSENQRESSIEDQVRVCTALVEQHGWTIAGTYTDYAITGTTLLRPGYQRLAEDARAGRLDVIIAESLDRISRDQEHLAGFFKQMSFAGIRIITRSEGEINELQIGFKGTMGAIYLKDLADKTHRGLEGRVRAGRSAGGISFGYKVNRELSADGNLQAGIRSIDDAEAAVIRRIFDSYCAGRSPRAIARMLNQEGVRGPRGGRWTASLILGNAARETGILRNRMYAGELVWNRQRFIKDPYTGKRVSRPRPREEWIVQPVPTLRIVGPAAWEVAQTRLASARQAIRAGTEGTDGVRISRGAGLVRARRPASLLSGLVRCGVCGGLLSVIGANGRLGCANYRERATCSNKRTVLRHKLEERVLAGLKNRLLAPELVEAFVSDYVREVNAANRERGQRRANLMQERWRLAQQISNTVEAIKEGVGSRTLLRELQAMEARQDEVEAAITTTGMDEELPVFHPGLAQLYRREVQRLEEALRDPDGAGLAVLALRSIVDAIVVHPGERRGETRVDLRGDLAAFLNLDDSGKNVAGQAVAQTDEMQSGQSMGSLVAGARNHLDLLLGG